MESGSKYLYEMYTCYQYKKINLLAVDHKK